MIAHVFDAWWGILKTVDKSKFPLKVGIIGSGWVATNRHIPSYRKISQVKIAAIIDRNSERAKLVSKRFGIPATYCSVDDVDQDLDAVSICTPPPTHCDLALACMKRHWNVLVEKPMAMTVKEADSMIKASQENHVKLSVVHNFVFSHSMLKAKALIAEGKLGEVLSIEILQTSNLRRHLPDWFKKLPGGLFFDEAPHAVYMNKFFLGQLTCTKANAETWDSDIQPIRSINAFFQSEQAGGHLNMIFNAGRDEWLVTVVGEKSLLSIDMFRDKLIVLGPGGRHTPQEVLLSSLDNIFQETRGVVSSSARWITGRLLFGHDLVVGGFIKSIISGSTPAVTAEEGREVVLVLCEVAKKAGL